MITLSQVVANISRVIIPVALFFIAQPPALSMEWTKIPKLQLAYTYDDNITLAAPGLEKSDYITQIRPGITLQGLTKNTKLDLSYQLEDIIYSDSAYSDKIYHQGTLTSVSNYLNKHLFLDTNFLYSQTNTSASDAVALDNLAITSNRTNLFDYNIHPYIIAPVGTQAELQANYIYAGKNYGSNQSQSDSISKTVSLNLNNHKNYYRLIWDLNYSNAVTDYDIGGRVEFRDANAKIKYSVTSKTYVTMTAGDEKNIYPYNLADKPPEGTYWKSGIGWHPSNRTLLEVQTGERFFGKTKEALLNHKSKHSVWTLKYDETLQTQNTNNAIGLPGLNTQTINQLSSLSNVFTSEVFLSKRIAANVVWKTRKTSFTINGFDEKRTYQVLKDSDRTRGLDINWSWSYTNNNSLNIKQTSILQEFRSSNRVDNLSDTTIELARKIQLNLTGKIAVRKLTRKSNFVGNDYQRNQITILIDMQF